MELVIHNRIIDCDVEEILDKLALQCEGKYLQRMNRKSDFVQIACPFHKDGQERKPSCSVYNRHDNPEVVFGTYHCFTCGSTGPLWKLVAKVLNITYEDAQYWLIENFSNVFEDRRPILESFEEVDIPKTYLDESILEEYSYLHPYQFQRGLTEEIIKRFKVGWNPKTDSITFPVWDDKNNLVGITERHTKSKRFYIPSDMDKPIYLLNYIKQNNITEVIVCESQINTLTCWSWGIPAIGLIGTGSTKQYDILKKSGIRVYHLALDGDLAGEHGTQRFIKNMPSNVMIDIIPIPQGKDVNDLTKEEFLYYYNHRI